MSEMHHCCKTTTPNERYHQFKQTLLKSIIAFVVGLPLLVDLHWSFLPSILSDAIQWPWIIVSILTFGVLSYCGSGFFKGAWHALKKAQANMDTLVAMGTGVAWLYSTIVVFFPSLIPAMARHVYFEAANILIAFILFGSALELRARGKTSEAIEKLMDLSPKTAVVIRDGQEKTVPLSDVQKGDEIRIKPGESIPVDGVVIEGESFVNESMLTGEPEPVAKEKGSVVSAGTSNESGSFVFRATKVGNETALARIIALVKKAQESKPQISKLVDQVAAVFVPIVILIAIVTAVVWWFVAPEPKVAFMLTTSIAVLVIACPCALGLATPISVMVGVGKAAQLGVLIRDGNALQTAKQLTTIVFDKTGTLTKGEPEVTDIIVYHGDENKLIELAYQVEQNSEHPLAKAITARYKQNASSEKTRASVSDFYAEKGKGVSAVVDGKKVLIGNASYLKQQGIDIDSALSEMDKLAETGETPIGLAQDGVLLGVIMIEDVIKSEAKEVVSRLQSMRINVVMLTGDNKKTAHAVASLLNIKKVFAEVLPQDKSKKIESLQNAGEIVAMVGDGINDAPALAQSNLGIAMGEGADVAMESADITLMNNHLTTVIHAISLSCATVRNIKQNLFGAFFYNVCAIPIAAGVLYPLTGWLLNPMIAGLAMAMSSVTVVLNANRLRFFRH